jgi:hypothetical protein
MQEAKEGVDLRLAVSMPLWGQVEKCGSEHQDNCEDNMVGGLSSSTYVDDKSEVSEMKKRYVLLHSINKCFWVGVSVASIPY